MIHINLMKKMSAIGLAALVAGTASFTASAAQASKNDKTINVMSVQGVDGASPQAAIWEKAPVTLVALQAAFPGHPAIVGTPVTDKLNVQAVRSAERLYVRIAWSDSTANTVISDSNKFADGAAVQFPVNGKSDTTPFMGDVNNPVNVWHWRADGRTQNLIAYGFGSAKLVPFDGLKTASVRTDSGWAVVLTRPLRVKPNEGAKLPNKGAMPIAFAAWDGQNEERDGLKAVTLEWWQLKF